ncbi:MAG: antitoxin VbhA family protein [Oscillospiraceae bacterium]|nr:antitoxin VbhA family protein [Oscillospiraceae bacterium]
MSEQEYNILRSSLASTYMEGFPVTGQTETDCLRLLRGEISVADLVKEICARPSKAV